MKPYKTGQGVWQASMTARDGKRITFYLGKMIDHREAWRQARILTKLIASPERTWQMEHGQDYMSLSEGVRGSLQRHFEFFRPTDLECLFERHAVSKIHLKKSSMGKYRDYYRRMLAFFGDVAPSSITAEDVERFRSWCKQDGLSEATLSRGLRACKSIFKFGIDKGLLLHNPFEKIGRGSEANFDRMIYIDRDKFGRLLTFCRDDRERLILALARLGGFRIPSEIRDLRFRDFNETIIRIRENTKTGFREVPLFAEIDRIFRCLRGRPDDFVFGTVLQHGPRDMLKRVIVSSGMEVWPKPFVNLRSSCITDFVTMGYTDKALDAMFGNSARVREIHYIQFRRDSEYRRMLEDNRCLAEYLRYRMSDDTERVLEPWDLREIVIAQRVANRSK